MATKDLFGRQEAAMDKYISCIKYMLFCLNIVGWMFGASILGMSIWMRKDPGLEEWVTRLELHQAYAGVYILILSGLIIMITSFIGCCSALTENQQALKIFIGTQGLSFIVGLAGSAVLLDYSTYDSHIQPLIREVFRKLIMNSQYDDVSYVLNQLQESISCCGADGPRDYVELHRPLPTECRDSVTGNAFFYGCVDELTWFLEERSAWLAGLAMTMCFINVVQAVLSIVLIQALRKEEERN